MLRIKLVKSPIGHNTRNRATVQALGLRKVHHVVEHEDTPTIRGMIHHVKDLLVVEVAEGTPAKTNGTRPNRPAGTQKAPKPKREPKPRTEAKPKPVKAERPATVKKTAKTTPDKKTTSKDAPAKVAAGAKPKAKPATAKAPTPSKKKSEEK